MKRNVHLQFFAEEAKQGAQEEAEAGAVLPEEETEAEADEPDTKPESDTDTDPEKDAFVRRFLEDHTETNGLSEAHIHALGAYLARMKEETKALAAIFPDFDLARELQNPAFVRLTAPENGVHAEDVYYALHRKELQAAQTEMKSPAPPKAPVNRPHENGLAGKAPAVMSFDYRNASKAHRDALKKAIRAAAAKGERIYPK